MSDSDDRYNAIVSELAELHDTLDAASVALLRFDRQFSAELVTELPAELADQLRAVAPAIGRFLSRMGLPRAGS